MHYTVSNSGERWWWSDLRLKRSVSALFLPLSASHTTYTITSCFRTWAWGCWVVPENANRIGAWQTFSSSLGHPKRQNGIFQRPTWNISQQGKKKKSWMTLSGATIFAWPHSSQQVLCPLATLYFFKKGNKKEQVKGKMEKRKVVKVQNRC